MPKKQEKPESGPKVRPSEKGAGTVKNLSAQALNAAKQFKDVYQPRTPAKLKGKHAAAIKRAVRSYYLG